MTSITRLDDQHCQALCGGGMPSICKPQVCYPSKPSYHVSTRYVSKASTYLAQGNYSTNTVIAIGDFAGWANAESVQSNFASITTQAG
jgi:hypothetical protein